MKIEKIQKDDSFFWLDVSDPSPQDLEEIAKTYNLHPTSLQDCMNPEHLPKIESIEGINFLIVRSYDEKAGSDVESIQKMTRKLIIFYNEQFIITIHRTEISYLNESKVMWNKKLPVLKRNYSLILLQKLLKAAFLTYSHGLDLCFDEREVLEKTLFNTKKKSSKEMLKVHHLKRKIFMLKRLLRYHHEILPKLWHEIDVPSRPFYVDLKEIIEDASFYADEISEGITGLMQLEMSLESQRTNESMRVLTVFSVFFMPLTFICGLYGMNFKYMPELQWEYGYPASLVLMLGVVLGLIYWFKKKGQI